MKKPLPKRNHKRHPAPTPRFDRRVVVIDRARHEIGGELRIVEAVKIAIVDLNARREIEVSYALRLEGFISATFAKKHEVLKALKDGNLDAFLKDLVPIPDAVPAASALTSVEEPLGETMKHLVAENHRSLAEDESSHTGVSSNSP